MNTQDDRITKDNLSILTENHPEVKLLYGQDCSKNLFGQVHLGETLDTNEDTTGENILPTAYYFIPSNGEIGGPVKLRADHLSAFLIKGEKGRIRIDYPYGPFNGN